MTQEIGYGGLKLLPSPKRLGMPTRVIEYEVVYKVGQPVACPSDQAGSIRSRRFVGPIRSEAPVRTPGSVILDEGVRGIVADPTLDPRK